jgi:hypothetical protein
VRALIFSLALVGCSSGAVRTYSSQGPVTCHDPDCAAVENHLDVVIEERGSVRKTLWKLMKMGDRAVPALTRELEVEEVARVQIAAYMLIAMGHGAMIDAWCRTLSDRDLACVRD